MVREHIRFTGNVQGVGFRFTCQQLATRLGLTGWVRNDPDGAVTGEFQGSPGDIEALLAGLKMQRFIRIDYAERVEIPLQPGDSRFQVTN